jgi:hypothetical protein
LLSVIENFTIFTTSSRAGEEATVETSLWDF